MVKGWLDLNKIIANRTQFCISFYRKIHQSSKNLSTKKATHFRHFRFHVLTLIFESDFKYLVVKSFHDLPYYLSVNPLKRNDLTFQLQPLVIKLAKLKETKGQIRVSTFPILLFFYVNKKSFTNYNAVPCSWQAFVNTFISSNLCYCTLQV